MRRPLLKRVVASRRVKAGFGEERQSEERVC
jgi:hypothetical protein